jgi:SNARE protein
MASGQRRSGSVPGQFVGGVELGGVGGMSEELGYLEEELIDLIAEVQRGVDGLRRQTGVSKTEKLAELANRLQRARQVLHSYKVELRDLPRDKTAPYELRHREHQETLAALNRELIAQQQEHERAQVGVRTVDEMSTQEVLQEAGKVQDQSLGALKRMQQNIAASREVGTATAAALEDQTKQLKNIDTDIMKVKSNLVRADLLVRAFMRKIMTDKIIMLFMCLIFTGVVVIVVWKIVNPQGVRDAGLNVPDQVVDPLGLGSSSRPVAGSSAASSSASSTGGSRRLLVDVLSEPAERGLEGALAALHRRLLQLGPLGSSTRSPLLHDEGHQQQRP